VTTIDKARERYSREGETEAQRLDRNYSELLQELRVAQTGVQILFAFLLGIAFQQRFAEVGTLGRAVFVTTLLLAACAAVLLIAPVAAHRVLFAQHRKDEVVAFSGRAAAWGLGFLATAIVGAVVFVLGFLLNAPATAAAGVALAVLVLTLWYVLPRRLVKGQGVQPSPPARDHRGSASSDEHNAAEPR
jgi:high-affinity Fe2+/Pb2+ permease